MQETELAAHLGEQLRARRYAALAEDLDALAAWCRATAALPPSLQAVVLPTTVTSIPEVPGAPAPDATGPALAREIPPGLPFERQLRGGVLAGRIRVPETVVRELNLHTGDRLRYAPDRERGAGRFRFTVATRAPEPADRPRTVWSMALVEALGDHLVVGHCQGDGRTFDPPVVLRPADVEALRLRAGDLVDLAAWADEPASRMVVWKYQGLVRLETPGPESRGAHSRRAPTDVAPPEAVPQILAGVAVLVVGWGPRHPEYALAVTAAGGRFEGYTGDEPADRLEAAVKRADVVVILKGMMGHQGVNDTKRFAKKHGVPYSLCGAAGVQTVVKRAASLVVRDATA